jgi:ABC-type lipoprotein release transport system permease subunit
MSLYLRLAWRNTWRHRRRTLIVVLSIGLTMALFMLYDGIIAGFEQSIYGNAIKVLGGNIQIHAAGYSATTDVAPLLPMQNEQAIIDAALAQPHVLSASRRSNTSGLVSSRKGAFPISIVGIEPEKEMSVSLVQQHVVAGRNLTAGDADVVFIGKGLADQLNVSVNDRITLVGRGAHEQMRQRTMTVVGIYDVGMADVEKQSAYISLTEAQDLYGLSGQSTEVAISLEKLGQEHPVMNALRPILTGYEITSWETSFPELQSAIQTKGGVMNIFGVIMFFIAGIGILNQLLMAIYERTREIGVLGALGVRPREISILFLLEGAMMGLVGVAFGIGLGLLINIIFGRVGMDYSQFSGMTSYTALITGRIYPTLGIDKLAQRALPAIIIAILAAFIPAREAAQTEPAQALHYV